MVPSSVITVATDGECLTCGGFSLGEPVRLGNFEFTANYFGGLSLSPRRGDSGTTFMGSTRCGASTPWRAMIEDSAEEFLTASSGDGGSGLPSPRRHDMGASLAPFTTTPRMENALIAQSMMTVPPRTTAPWVEVGLPFERCHAHHRGVAGARSCSIAHR
jgi:hypothetical protein